LWALEEDPLNYSRIEFTLIAWGAVGWGEGGYGLIGSSHREVIRFPIGVRFGHNILA